MFEWINLTTHLGETVQSPSEAELKKALQELFLSQDDEHPDTWIECGSELGPLYSLAVFSSGYAIYTKFSDADMSEELEDKRIENVSADLGFALWKKLIDQGEI